MAINVSLTLLKLFLSLARTKEATKPAILLDEPQKSKVLSKNPSTKLERCTPEEVGIKKEYIDSFIHEVESDSSVFMNRFMMAKDNKVIYEYAKHPYDLNTWNASFSLTKTTVGLAIGMLIEDGLLSLNDNAFKILLPKNAASSNYNKSITIRNLLMMSTGCKFNEAYTAASKKWVKDFFNTSNKFKPGTSFDYNSLNTYILSAIVKKVSKKSLSHFLKERLFDPLGIKDFYYSLSPEKIEQGGWGLYITPEDMVKLGLLFINKGVWEGKRIINEEWLNEMSHVQIKAQGSSFNGYNYGYQMWANDAHDIAVFNGMFDQDIVICRKTGVVLIWCCSNCDAFHTSNIFRYAEHYFAEEIKEHFRYVPAPEYKDLENDTSLYPLYTKRLRGNTFYPTTKNAVSTSILPLLLQTTMNTFAEGLNSINFEDKDGEYTCKFHEGKDKEFTIKYNFGEGIRQTINLYGNEYEVSVDAKMRRTDDDTPYLLIRIFFLEFSTRRYIKVLLTRKKSECFLKLSEYPSTEVVYKVLEIQDKQMKRVVKNATALISEDVLTMKINNLLNPKLLFTTKKPEEKQK